MLFLASVEPESASMLAFLFAYFLAIYSLRSSGIYIKKKRDSRSRKATEKLSLLLSAINYRATRRANLAIMSFVAMTHIRSAVL